MSRLSPEDIDAVLPQTQCGLCTYGGCMPYANALVNEQAAINLCPPGGVKTLQTLGELLAQDITPYLDDMEKKAKPKMLAVIRESECIGCTKCIQACPVDAILGGAKQMHTVIASECTGCELCVSPCPVDCIDIIPATEKELTQVEKNNARMRFNQRQQRLLQEKSVKKSPQTSADLKKSYIQQAIARAKAKRLEVK